MSEGITVESPASRPRAFEPKAAKPSAPVLSLRGVEKIYRQGKIEVPALRGIDLDVSPGAFIVLAGASGCGKTTLLNLAGALDVPTKGTIELSGKRLDQMSSSELSRLRLFELGFVFQAYNLIPVLSAYENAEYVLLLQGVASDERRRRVETMLRDVGLAGLEGRRPAEMSGGQQQRVAIARALCPNPKVLLADEPTANLDSHTGDELIDLMHQLNRQRGTTCLIASHDPRVIERADRAIWMEDGRILRDERH